jgi:hypothetical protein
MGVLALSLVANAAEVTVVWDANDPAQQVTEYVVYVDDAEIARTAGTTQIVDVTPGAHVFEVTASNIWQESPRSAPVSTPPVATAPVVTVIVTVVVQ